MNDKIDMKRTTYDVFSRCFPIYLQEDKHWGGDLDVILNEIDSYDKPRILDAGCGPGWHLINMYWLRPELPELVGMDYCPQMAGSADVNVTRFGMGDKIKIRLGDVRQIPFNDHYFDIVISMNNTMGNLSGRSFEESRIFRQRALKEFKRVLAENGSLVVSVYNLDRFTEKDRYGEVFRLDERLSDPKNGDFVVRFYDSKNPSGIPYYSHWFQREELARLFEKGSFEVVFSETRMKRIVMAGRSRD